MATLTGETIASTYKSLLKSTSAIPALVTGSTTERLVFGEDDAADVRTAIYVSQDRVGIGVAAPGSTLDILDTTTQLKLSYDAGNYASFTIAADGLLNIVTVDPDGAEADICLNPDGNVGIGTVAPATDFVVSDGANPGDGGIEFNPGAATNSITHYNRDTSAYINVSTAALEFTWNAGSTPAAAMHIGADKNVGIGTVVPAQNLHIHNSTTTNMRISSDDDSNMYIEFKPTTATRGFVGWDETQSTLKLVTGTTFNDSTSGISILNSGFVGIGLAVPTTPLHADQSSASGAVPVLRLDQGDADETFIDFIGSSQADGSASISSDTTTDSAKFGAIRIEINGTHKWIRIYDDHS